MNNNYRKRRIIVGIIFLGFIVFSIIQNTTFQKETSHKNEEPQIVRSNSILASDTLQKLEVKGRAPKTGYSRDMFGGGWATKDGCNTRNIILNRDLDNVVIDEKCNVLSGTLNDPYTGKIISFVRGSDTSSSVQIDHVVALSDAWQKGAQQLDSKTRLELANDPLELLAVDGSANQQKSDGDAATWLPSNKSFRCQYVARQIAVKYKYNLWVTQSEGDAMKRVLQKCPDQLLPNP